MKKNKVKNEDENLQLFIYAISTNINFISDENPIY